MTYKDRIILDHSCASRSPGLERMRHWSPKDQQPDAAEALMMKNEEKSLAVIESSSG